MRNDTSNSPINSINKYLKAVVLLAIVAAVHLTFPGCSSDNDDVSNDNTAGVGSPLDDGITATGSGGSGAVVAEPTTGAQAGQGSGSTQSGASCGNGRFDPGEECEQGIPVKTKCESKGFPGGGTLKCDLTTCKFDTSGCSSVMPGIDGGVTSGDGGSDVVDEVDAAEQPVDPGPGPGAETGILPVPAFLDAPGPFEVLDVANTGPRGNYHLFIPQPLGENGLKHPVVAWSPGAGAFPEAYWFLLNLLASHGFVTLSYNTTGDGPVQKAAIDWFFAENERQGSDLYGKLDTTKVAAGGHSAGSLATFAMADDPRLTTTLHIAGGSFTPQTDIPRLRKPALMVCGDAGGDGLQTGDIANPMCNTDFDMAEVPVFFAVVVKGGHANLNDAEATLNVGMPNDDPRKLLFIKAMIGWLRWLLADDQSLRKMFVGDDCELCAPDSGYIVKQKDLDSL